MSELSKAAQVAIKWLRERGGSAAIAVTKAGGRQFLAQGEIGPFTVGTVKQLIDFGMAEYVTIGANPQRVIKRLSLTARGLRA